ncbi:MAG: PTS sugar transporter subunit IIA [Peptostreptococcaceae bacterium]
MNSVLNENNVVLNLDSVSKEEAIVMCGKKLVENGYVNESYIQAMLDREELMTTFMGMGVAIPHGVNEAKKEIKKSGIVVLQFPNGIDFDGELAYLMIGIAGVGDEHLEILSNIATVLDDELTDRLKDTDSKAQIIEAFTN